MSSNQSDAEPVQRLASDPRDPTRISTYKVDNAEDPADWAALLSLVFGVVGLTMRIKVLAWLSLFCSITSIANFPTNNFEVKQIFSSLAFAVLSIIMNYFAPVPPGAASS